MHLNYPEELEKRREIHHNEKVSMYFHWNDRTFDCYRILDSNIYLGCILYIHMIQSEDHRHLSCRNPFYLHLIYKDFLDHPRRAFLVHFLAERGVASGVAEAEAQVTAGVHATRETVVLRVAGQGRIEAFRVGMLLPERLGFPPRFLHIPPDFIFEEQDGSSADHENEGE